MNGQDKRKQIVQEAIIILLIMILLVFICRLWPILLLLILGLFAAVIRLVFISAKKVEVVDPKPVTERTPVIPTETDVFKLAYSVILRRITELIIKDHPEARWIWETPNVQKHIKDGDEVFILLNRAGGYKRAKVVISNLQVIGIEYNPVTNEPADDSKPDSDTDSTDDAEPLEENFEFLAFEWVDANIMLLNERCNEAIGNGITELLIKADELPTRESWEDVCHELKRADIKDAKCVPEGIKVNLMQ